MDKFYERHKLPQPEEDQREVPYRSVSTPTEYVLKNLPTVNKTASLQAQVASLVNEFYPTLKKDRTSNVHTRLQKIKDKGTEGWRVLRSHQTKMLQANHG